MCMKKNWLANTGKVGSYQCSYIVSWIAYCSCDGPLTLSSVLDWIFCPEGKDEFEPSFFFFFLEYNNYYYFFEEVYNYF